MFSQEGRRAVALSLCAVGLAFAAFAGCATAMPGHDPRGALSALPPEARGLPAALEADVRNLAEELGERNLEGADNEQVYAHAAAWIAGELRAAGLAVHEETYFVGGHLSRNLVGERPGQGAAAEIVVIGAHYDSVEGGTPGADDNASGVAALLALARRFGKAPSARTLRFVAFANEEPPYFQTEQMGSLVYARGCAARGERVVAMLSLETMGLFSEVPGSQHYPFPFDVLYPSTGDFLAFVGNARSTRLVRESVAAFRRTKMLPAEGAAVPDLAPGIGWSDHWSFWQTGVPALMVTDTAPFRNPNYHEEGDTPETLDYQKLARAVVGLAAVVEGLAGQRRVDGPVNPE